MSALAEDRRLDDRERVTTLVYRSFELLDECAWHTWLEQCAPDFAYKIVAYSPEIRRDMIWLDHDLAGLRTMVDLLPKHYSDRSRLTRHASLYRTSARPDGTWEALSSVAVYRTDLDGGATSLFAIGKYADVLSVDGEDARFVARTIRLDTRELWLGTHFPL